MEKRPPSFGLHAARRRRLILTLVTAGLWGIVWIVLAITGGEKRNLVNVDEYGQTSVQKL